MKKYLMLVTLFLIIFLQTSCIIKDDLEPKGDILTAEEIQELTADYIEYTDKNKNKIKDFDQWYKIDYLYETNHKIKYEPSGTSVNIGYSIIKISGKLYESAILYNTRADLDVEMTTYVYKHSKEQYYKMNLKCKLVNGIAYYKMNYKYEKKENSEVVKKEKDTVKFYGELEDFYKIIDINQSLYDLTSTNQIFSSILANFNTPSNENTNQHLMKDNNTYCYIDYNSHLSRIEFKLNKDYTTNKIKMYSTSSNRQDSTYVKIEKCLGKVIIKPINHNKYISYDDVEFIKIELDV